MIVRRGLAVRGGRPRKLALLVRILLEEVLLARRALRAIIVLTTTAPLRLNADMATTAPRGAALSRRALSVTTVSDTRKIISYRATTVITAHSDRYLRRRARKDLIVWMHLI